MVYNIQVPPYLSGESLIAADGYSGKKEMEYTLLSIGKESYLTGVVENSDEFFLTVGRLVHNLQIGRYCSIAGEVYFLIGRGKDYFRVTTSAAKVFHQNVQDLDLLHREKGSIIIQNDVWIGRKVSVMSGVTIHNGAIVAANSHVVKDVPAYAIVGGNPAKVIGYRFEKEIIDKLQTIQWWYWDEAKIKENAKYFEDIKGFCDCFYDEAKADIDMIRSEPLSILEEDKDRYFMLIDHEDHYSVTFVVLEEFFEKHKYDFRKQLLLFMFDYEEIENTEFVDRVNQFIDRMSENEEIQCSVRFLKGNMEDLKRLFSMINHLVINRRIETVQLMCYAEVYGNDIEIISGVDIPVF